MTPTNMSEILAQMLAVLLVFGLLGAALWAVRRGRGTSWAGLTRRAGAEKVLEAVEKLALTPQHTLHLIRANGREWLVATHPQGCTVIRDDRGTEASV
jgi:flagellar biogenesis protein FliO